MEDNKNFCKDCKHFAQYYSQLYINFIKTNKGACHKKSNSCEKLADTAGCKYFEPKEDFSNQLKKRMKNYIKQIDLHMMFLTWFINENDK